VTDGDDGELGGDEEGVGQHEQADGRQAEAGRKLHTSGRGGQARAERQARSGPTNPGCDACAVGAACLKPLPASSSRLSRPRMPVITATTACGASRPVAKAFGDGLWTTATRGLGSRAWVASSSTRRCSSGAWSQLTSLRAGHAQRDVAGEPVRAEVHHDGQGEGEQYAALPAQGAADDDEQRGQRREQDRGLYGIAHLLLKRWCRGRPLHLFRVYEGHLRPT
jgi:hypothetical protein